MSGPHSGRWGVVNGLSTIRDWTVNDLIENRPYRASNTRSGTGRKRGIRDWNGSFNGYGFVPAIMPGETFTFKGFTAPDNDAESGGSGTTYEGQAIVDSIVITWNWGSAEIGSYALNFSGDGPLANAVEAALLDSTDPDVPEVCGTKVDYNVGGGDEEWGNLTQAVLTLTSENSAYANSSTVYDGVCWRRRKKGNFDWTLALTEQETSRATLPGIGDDVGFKLYTDDEDFWALNWGKIENYSNITVNRDTGEILSRQVNIAMNGFDEGVGFVKIPGGDTLWPFT